MVDNLKRAHSCSPSSFDTDPLTKSLRANLRDCKLEYGDATNSRERKRLQARMRRSVRALSINEHMSFVRALLAARHNNAKSFWNLFKDKDVQNELPFPVHDITAHFASVMGSCCAPSPFTPKLDMLFSSTVNKASHEPLTAMELFTAVK